MSRSSRSADSDFFELQAHPAKDLRRLRELDVAVLDDLDVVAPRVSERVAAEDLDAGLAGGGEHRGAVVDDEAEVALAVGLAVRALGEREELVAHVDERHPADPAAQLDLEQTSVESQRLVERADLECDVIDTDRTSHGNQHYPAGV